MPKLYKGIREPAPTALDALKEIEVWTRPEHYREGCKNPEQPSAVSLVESIRLLVLAQIEHAEPMSAQEYDARTAQIAKDLNVAVAQPVDPQPSRVIAELQAHIGDLVNTLKTIRTDCERMAGTINEMIGTEAEDAEDAEQTTPFYCQDCDYHGVLADFRPGDGNPAPIVCPECGRTNCFTDDAEDKS